LKRAVQLATALFALLTLAMIVRMFWYLHLSISNVLRNDQWIELEEIWRFRDGRFGWGYLWTPYWGQRMVLPRLLFLLDERYLHYSNTPLVWINVLAQCGMAAILVFLARRLVKSYWIPAAAVTAHLVFSSLQLENIAFGGSINYTTGLLASLAAMVLFPRRPRWAIVCAIISTLSLTSGLFVWPILILEALILRANRKVIVALSLAWIAITIAYAIGFTNPGGGMGAPGMLRRPFQAFLIASLVLGGPLSDVHQWLGELVGASGFVIAVWFSITTARRKLPVEHLALTAVCWYVMAAVAMGRITPEWLAARGSQGPLPGRYFTGPFLFWSSAFILSLYHAAKARLLFAGTALAVAGLTIGTLSWQLWESVNWQTYYRRIDAAASGFFVGASDPQYMAEMFPDQRLLDHWAPYLKDQHLSVFADRRAAWLGDNIHRLFPPNSAETCRGRVDESAPAGVSALRLLGYVAGPGLSLNRKTDILFADASGKIVGLGRSLATQDARGGEKFLGYAPGGEPRAAERYATYALIPQGHLCRLQQ
jgi:hypothetical protein